MRQHDGWDRGPSMHGRASGRGRVYQAGRDMRLEGNHQHHHDYDLDPMGTAALFTGRGPGRVLLAIGWLVILFCFAGWASIVFGMATGSGPAPGAGFEGMLGKRLPSGVPVGIVYFLGCAAGGAVAMLGGGMAKAAARGRGVLAHLVVSVVVVAAGGVGVIGVLDGAPLSALLPHFG